MSKPFGLVLIAVFAGASVSTAQPPVRKYDDKGAPPFKVLKEGENPPLDAYDNFVIGPKYVPAPIRTKVEGVPEIVRRDRRRWRKPALASSVSGRRLAPRPDFDAGSRWWGI